MNPTVALLLVAAIGLLALLGLALIHSRLPVVAKLLLIGMTTALYYASYHGWKQAQGWPTHTPLPEKFLLYASVIEEPDPEKGVTGHIFIWAADLEGNRPASHPRAYRLPYGKEAHSALEDALRNQRNGNIQIGSSKRSGQQAGEVPKNMSGMGEEQTKLDFSNLPDPALPEK